MTQQKAITFTLLIAVEIILTACTSNSKIPDSRPMFATPAAKRLVQNHTLITLRPSIQTYLNAQYQQFSAQPNSSVLLFEDTEPFALLIDSSRVGISCGLITLTADDADLAFVLAHEAAHLTLKHYLLDHPGPNEELQADNAALKTLIALGYSTENTYKIITKLYQHNEHLSEEYPSTRERLYQYWSIREELKQKRQPGKLTPSKHLIGLKAACLQQEKIATNTR